MNQQALEHVTNKIRAEYSNTLPCIGEQESKQTELHNDQQLVLFM